MVGETSTRNNDGMNTGEKSVCPSTAFTEIFSGKKFQQLGNRSLLHSEWRYLGHIQQRSSRSRSFASTTQNCLSVRRNKVSAYADYISFRYPFSSKFSVYSVFFDLHWCNGMPFSGTLSLQGKRGKIFETEDTQPPTFCFYFAYFPQVEFVSAASSVLLFLSYLTLCNGPLKCHQIRAVGPQASISTTCIG